MYEKINKYSQSDGKEMNIYKFLRYNSWTEFPETEKTFDQQTVTDPAHNILLPSHFQTSIW